MEFSRDGSGSAECASERVAAVCSVILHVLRLIISSSSG